MIYRLVIEYNEYSLCINNSYITQKSPHIDTLPYQTNRYFCMFWYFVECTYTETILSKRCGDYEQPDIDEKRVLSYTNNYKGGISLFLH